MSQLVNVLGKVLVVSTALLGAGIFGFIVYAFFDKESKERNNSFLNACKVVFVSGILGSIISFFFLSVLY